ncbi:MAG: hypothetical protein QM767_22305 [Anaeromyxobacter sp.]
MPLPLAPLLLAALLAPPPSSLEAIPLPPGSARDGAEEARRASWGRPPYLPGPADTAVGEELGGELLQGRRFQVFTTRRSAAEAVAFYRRTLGGAKGRCNGDDLTDPRQLAAGGSSPVLASTCTSGGGDVSHPFRWRHREAGGALVTLEVAVEEPTAGSRSVRLVLLEARYAGAAAAAAPDQAELGVPVHPSMRHDVNASVKGVVEVQAFRSSATVETLAAFYRSALHRDPSDADGKRVFILGDPPDYNHTLVIERDSAGQTWVKLVRM